MTKVKKKVFYLKSNEYLPIEERKQCNLDRRQYNAKANCIEIKTNYTRSSQNNLF